MSCLTPGKIRIGYTVSRRKAEPGYRKEDLPTLDRLATDKPNWFAKNRRHRSGGRLIPGSGFKVGFGYMVIMPKAAYLTWHGQKFEGRGIVPDVDDRAMQIALPDLATPATRILDREHRLTDEAYLAFSVANPELNVERTREGEIVIVPPPGGESDFRAVEAGGNLRDWARRDGWSKASFCRSERSGRGCKVTSRFV